MYWYGLYEWNHFLFYSSADLCVWKWPVSSLKEGICILTDSWQCVVCVQMLATCGLAIWSEAEKKGSC